MASVKILQGFTETLRKGHRDEPTLIRLADVIRKNVAEKPNLLGTLGLTQEELDHFPRHQ